MTSVWIAFLVTALLLAIGAWAAWRAKGERAGALRTVGGFLAALALGTAVFPLLLGPLGAGAWIGGYVGFVVAVTALMTIVAVRRALHAAAR